MLSAKGQFRRVGFVGANLVAKAAERGQSAGCLDEGRCEVDAFDLAAIGGGQEARRAADAAADIQDPIGWRGGKTSSMVLRGDELAAVKLVERIELRGTEAIGFWVGDRGQYALNDPVAAVVFCDVDHGGTPLGTEHPLTPGFRQS